MPANYQCLTCDHKWTEETKGGSPESSHGPTECPECGALYVLWSNWPANKPRLTATQNAALAEQMNSPFLTMH
jgi:DNA-directed RNA polymerase subunit RPC12/RpoP